MPEYLEPAIFNDLPGVAAGFSTRHGGVSDGAYAALNLGLSTGDDREAVLENRRRLFAAVGFDADRLVVAGQVHGDDLKIVTEPGLYLGFDALVTEVPGLVLAISAADCCAVLLADADSRIVGACHAGWRGAVAEIAVKTVATMQGLGAEPNRLRVYISPCISAENFEVGPEVAEQFDAAFVRRWPHKLKPHIDLKAAVAAQLEDAGVLTTNIEIAPHCTFAETDTFFSHRAENGTTGRMMGFIGMR